MPNNKNVHVVKHGENWAWRREGASRVSGIAPTQADAIKGGRQASRAGKGELFIHRPDGRIRDRDSHGNDPTTSPG